ncbi:site-specific DNA-methyltransferase [Alkalimarinus coralli]|uniref:site-specific DNA-methyltransferase n=1 Tax=Alkalimarinus coralli TaxID=2935863 RepID=UPI00202B9307|nr:site-specific DNA-methyltransferase [Alkalimarinus coralli]
MPILQWLNKEEAVVKAKKCAYRLLEEVPELSYGDNDNENLLIQGDNLEALKALIPFYSGKVKCVYIDPPFNTEQAFEHYDDNVEHSIWLGLMYARFELLNQLLSEDGTFFLHLDDNQISYATVICDEIFGRKNRIFMSTFKQSSASGPKAINPGVVTTASFIVCYAKNKSAWSPNKVYVPTNRDDRYTKFISNKTEPVENWETILLREAFADFSKVPVNELKKKYADKYEDKLHEFVLDNAESVIRTARVADKDVGEEAKKALAASREKTGVFFKAERTGKAPQYFFSGEQVAFYSSKTKLIDGTRTTAQPLTNIWDDLLSNNLHKEGEVKFKNGKKPEALIKRVIELSTAPGDIVLDSFLGSGSTAATAHKMERRYIGVEIGDQAVTHCQPRLKRVVENDQSGISKVVEWEGGGGFRFIKLGQTVFDEYGCLNPEIEFPTLAAHIWYLETKTPLNQENPSAYLGTYNDIAYYLLYNGILGDKRPQGGNVLTSKVLELLPELGQHQKKEIVVYGESTRLGETRLKQANITFKQIPYDVSAL